MSKETAEQRAAEAASQRIKTLTQRLQSLEGRLTSVSSSATQAAKAVASVSSKISQAVATLLDFDEISRLQEKTTSTSSGSSGKRSSSGSATASKTKTGQTEDYELDVRLSRPGRDVAEELIADVRLGLESGDDGGEAAGEGILARIATGISNAFGSAASWVNEHIWSPIKNAWSSLGGVVVSVGARLGSTAGELWSGFQSAWQSGTSKAVQIANSLASGAAALWQSFSTAWGTRAVTIANSLASGAAALWQSFSTAWGTRTVTIGNSLASTAAALWSVFTSDWGSRSVTIGNSLKNTAADLWNRFKAGWSGKTLGLKITYSTDVGAVKKAVYRALGLSGWPTISFAARGGIVDGATLLGSTVVGEAGAEAIIPLEEHTEWLDKVAARLAQAVNGSAGASGQPLVVQVTLDSRVVGQTAVEYINGVARSTGVNPVSAYL